MKKIVSFLLVIISLVSFFPLNVIASDTWYYIVTAYYSPLPDQNYYITGSYESEKRLNWKGIAGASGKKVFSGMLAAPWKYSFWTKIELDGLWIGSVDDRGWAIVPAWERWYGHDRIDVWVWYGDEWLRRAMYWGKRKIAWRVVWEKSSVTLNYKDIPAPTWAVPKTTTLYGKKVVVAQESQHKELDVFSLSLGKWSDSSYILQLQEILSEIWYYWEKTLSGIYDIHTINAVYNFQVNNEILQNEYDVWAWSYGPKTRQKLEEVYQLYLEEKKIEKQQQETITLLEQESYTLAKNKIELLWQPLYGNISPQVRDLQKILAKLWYFTYKDTAIFWVKTKNSLIDFQIKNEIISDTQQIWVWVFGPQTQKVMIQKLSEIYFDEALQWEWLKEVYENMLVKSSQEEQVSSWNEVSHWEVNFTILQV